MVRTPCCDETGFKKGTWTPEEDRKLAAYVTRYGCWNWRQLPKYAGLARCGKSCRLRWMNYLRPNIKRGNYTKEEDEIILKMHAELGNKWSAIAAHLPGRTDNEIKNHWHTSLKKHSKQPSSSSSTPNSQTKKRFKSSKRAKRLQDLQQNNPILSTSTHEILESSQWSPSSSGDSSPSSTKSDQITPEEFGQVECDESFWREPFLVDNLWSNNEFVVPSWMEFQHSSIHEILENYCEQSSSCGTSSSSPSASSTTTTVTTKSNQDQIIPDEFGHVECDESFWREPFLVDSSLSKNEFSVPSMDLGLLSPPSPFPNYEFLSSIWSFS